MPLPRETIPKQQGRKILEIVLGLLLLTILVFLVISYHRLEELSQEIFRLKTVSKTVAESAENALRQAVRAEENSLKAALGRARAEQEAFKARAVAAKSAEEAIIAKQEANRARQEAQNIRKERDEKLDRMQQALSQLVETRRTALGLIMNLDSQAIQFDFDKAILKTANRELLSKIAGILLTSKGYHIFVYGHTDDVGSIDYNQQLSEKRAQIVRDYLIKSYIDSDIVTSKGFGKSSPLVKDTSKEARAKNRRVEIAIVDTVLDYEQRIN
mgnify:FL=1